MLRTRVVTGLYSGCSAAAWAYSCCRPFGLCWPSARSSPSARGSLPDSARCAASLPAAPTRRPSRRCCCLSWRWTGDAGHLLALLSAACVWWVIAFLWLSLGAGAPPARLDASLRPARCWRRHSWRSQGCRSQGRDSLLRTVRRSCCGWCSWCARRTSALTSPDGPSDNVNWRRALVPARPGRARWADLRWWLWLPAAAQCILAYRPRPWSHSGAAWESFPSSAI